ncbi:DUF2262 domain-containing protein [Culicoidibacter larvae]|uniref:DUF2262 domain-containing protein n=1 Tax=Culicoidibacter larvae TaxID=2579976 RepID=A0A5R8QAJ5_9FIRM|nr:DUF2262 domain-containing protein [Culicoidibacter larvae]TLG72923.1 DUF2262 domain-containing protein [Culicoidibacter larvae]
MQKQRQTFIDQQLGTFVFHKSGYRDYYKGSYQCNGNKIILHMEERAFLADLQQIINNLDAYIIGAKTFILQELRPQIEAWSIYHDDESFLQQLQLNTIMQQEPQKYILWFDAGDLLLGHCICVYGHVQDGFSAAVIEG